MRWRCIRCSPRVPALARWRLLTWILFFAGTPEPTGDRFTTSAKAGPADFGAQHGFGAMFGAAPKAEGAAAAMEVEELDMFDVSYQDRLAVAARLFDLFIVRCAHSLFTFPCPLLSGWIPRRF